MRTRDLRVHLVNERVAMLQNGLLIERSLVRDLARALGRARAPMLGALIVIIAATHSVFAQLLTIARYYG